MARVVSIKNDVSFRTNQADWADLRQGQSLCWDDEVGTGPESELELVYSDGQRVTVYPLTQIVVGTMSVRYESRSPRLQVLLKAGEVAAKVNQQKAVEADFSIRTPTATASVRGTQFSVRYDPKRKVTSVSVKAGQVRVTPQNPALSPVVLQAGQRIEISERRVGPITSNVPWVRLRIE